jgi:hypothetical protein
MTADEKKQRFVELKTESKTANLSATASGSHELMSQLG